MEGDKLTVEKIREAVKELEKNKARTIGGYYVIEPKMVNYPLLKDDKHIEYRPKVPDRVTQELIKLGYSMEGVRRLKEIEVELLKKKLAKGLIR